MQHPRNDPKLLWAQDADGEVVHISEVKRGLQCGCICSAYKAPLVAKKGEIRQHHFAHAKGEECEHAVETSLHLAAKDILDKRREIVLPAVEVHFPHAPKYNEMVAPERRCLIKSVVLEQRLGSIIPDVIAVIGESWPCGATITTMSGRTRRSEIKRPQKRAGRLS